LNTKNRRIAINVGGGFGPGMNAVVGGVTLSAAELGWEVVGIRDGFAGLLEPGDYPGGGLLTVSPQLAESLDPAASSLLGQSPRVDPFHMRQVDEDGMVEEVDRSDELLAALQEHGIDAVISVVSGRGLSILYKLHRKGLNAVCIPRSPENDIAATMVALGFNSALSFTIEMLDRARETARSSRQIVVVEVQGEQAGWLALQAGIAAGADAILIPELPIDIDAVAEYLRGKMSVERPYGLVVVAEGAGLEEASASAGEPSSLQMSLSPLAAGESTGFAIHGTGRAAKIVANRLQLLLAEKTYPLVVGPWARGGQPTAVDRQLALAYGAGAVRALNAGQAGVMVSFQPPDIAFVPLPQSINKVRTVPADSEMMLIARTLGICLGGVQ
jgi:ATP-dependent phosphofructokinase / diphosphate-dependent phosphofructokinase